MKMLKFGIVGFIGMGWDFLVTWILKEKLKINKYVANSIGFTSAVINNFFLNFYWTFKATNGNETDYMIRFAIISVVGLALNNFFVWLFNEKLKVNFYVAKVLAVLCVFAWNFSANNYFNFGKA